MNGEPPPPEVVSARLVDELASRYGQLPSAIRREDARLLLRMRAIIAEAADTEER